MKIKREHQRFEIDVRFSAGKKLYQRVYSTAGFWHKEGPNVSHGSLTLQLNETRQLHLHAVLKEALRLLKRQGLSNYRVTLRADLRTVKTAKKFQQYKESIYIEIPGNQGFYFVAPLAQFNEGNFVKLLKEHFSYFKKPLLQTTLDVDTLTLTPSAFGFLLHEGLGHRHESDDHTARLKLKKSSLTNFSVVDSPGQETMLGHTPFDDWGVAGKDVVLYNGLTGKTNLLTAKSGNSRAVSHEYHPLIRQRCLIVKMHAKVEAPVAEGSLHIEDVRMGSWNGDLLELEVGKALYHDKKGQEWRLSPFTIKMKPELVSQMKAFGDLEISSPAGGCHKGLQRGLDISFLTPSAFINLNKSAVSDQLEFIF
ncbi:hypothetical protein [Bdellovibrio sp. HCB-162]|uniref:hypothetical protein n=1 Tax=Bdellovibrio sp. HCB-162 TaxID=3394234 RepID=UPI0039BC789A